MHVEQCYVHPIKGMTPAAIDPLVLSPGASPRGDRAFVFAFANAERHPSGWVGKHDAVTSLSVPRLAEITAGYDETARTLTLSSAGETRSAAVDDEAEREAIAAWLADHLRAVPKNPLDGHPEREPLLLLGNGDSRFTDRGPTQVSIGSLASLAALERAAAAPVDVRRFRFNLVIDGEQAWEEFGWAGKRLRVGEALLEVTAPLVRCKAVNANPDGGGRDINLLDVLDAEFGHLNFGVEATVVEGGSVHPGDPVTLLD